MKLRGVMLVVGVLLCATAYPEVSGIVAAADGTPLQGAEVWLLKNDRFRDRCRALGKVTTGPGGHFVFRTEIPTTPPDYHLLAFDEAHALGSEMVGRSRGETRLLLTPPGGLYLDVVGPDGQPRPDARAELLSIGDERHPLWASYSHTTPLPEALRARFAATADEDGRIALPLLPAGSTATLHVSAPGCASVIAGRESAAFRRSVRLPEPAALKLRLVAPEGADADLSRRVSMHTTQPTSSGPGLAEATTDESGLLHLTDLAPGEYQVTIYADPDAEWWPEQPTVEVVAGETAEVEVALTRGVPVTGRVVTEDGRGLPGAGLLVAGSPHRTFERFHVTTDSSGRYRLNAPPCTLAVRPWPLPRPWVSGENGFTKQEIPEGTTGPVEMPDIVLVRGVEISGTVVDAQGRPVAGAGVWQTEDSDSGMRTIYLSQSTHTDEQGRFRLPPRRAGSKMLLVAVHDERMTPEPTSVTASSDRSVRLKVHAGGGAFVSGRVVEKTGEAVPDVLVDLILRPADLDRGGRTRCATVLTGADGRFRIGPLLTPVHCQVLVRAPDADAATTDPRLASRGEDVDFGDISIARADVVISGTVTDIDGQPLAGAAVFSNDAPERVTAVAGPDGAFSLQGLRSDDGWVFAEAEGHHFGGVRAAGDGVRIELCPIGRTAPWAGEALLRETLPEKQRAQLARRLLDAFEGSGEAGRYLDRTLGYYAALDPDDALDRAVRAGLDADSYFMMMYADSLAESDPSAALRIYRTTDTRSRYSNYLSRFAMKVARTDPELAREAISELVWMAETDRRPTTAIYRAYAGEAAWEIGEHKWAQQILLDAVKPASTLGASDTDAYYRGLTAARVALVDVDAALGLLEPMAEDSDRDRYLMAVAGRVARVDPERAVALVEAEDEADGAPRVAPGLSQPLPRIAGEAARTDPRYALQLIRQAADDDDASASYVSAACLSVAIATHESDPEVAREALKTFEAVATAASGHPGRSSAGLLASAGIVASWCGHPDPRSLLLRALAEPVGDRRMHEVLPEAYRMRQRTEELVPIGLAMPDEVGEELATWLMENTDAIDYWWVETLSSLAVIDPEEALMVYEVLRDEMDERYRGRVAYSLIEALASSPREVLLSRLSRHSVWVDGHSYE